MSGSNGNNGDKLTPCYVPFDTFEAFIGRLKQTTVPDTIHKSLMPNLSGGVQSHLIASLKFLDLIGPDGVVRDNLSKLAEAHGTSEWKPALKYVIEAAYRPIIGDLNVEKAIGKTLQDRFKEATSYDGTTLDKVLCFYIKAIKTAGVNVSQHIKVRKPTTNRRATANAAKGAPANGANHPVADTELQNTTRPLSPGKEAPAGMIQIPIYVPGGPMGTIIVHEDLNEADCKMINTILMAYATRRAEKR